MKTVKLIAIAALCAGLASCAGFGGVRTIKGDWSAYSLKYLRYAASNGMLPTIVKGQASTATSPAALEERVLTELSSRPLGVGPIAFVPYHFGQGTPPLFVSMVFNPEPSFDSRAACDPERADEAGGQARPDGSIRVVAAFCSSQQLLSGSVGYADALTGVDDPRLNQLIRLLAIDLFPPRDSNTNSSCDSCP